MSILKTVKLQRLSDQPFFCRHLTPKSFATLAVEHLRLLDLACTTVLAGVWLAGVVTAFTNSTAVQNVASVLLEVEQPVVDIQQADAAHQSCGHRCPFSCTDDEKGARQKVTIMTLLT